MSGSAIRLIITCHNLTGSFPGGSDDKESACNEGDMGSIPGPGGSPREGSGYPLHYSCLGNPMDRCPEDCKRGHKESDMTKRLTLSLFTFIISLFHVLIFSPFVKSNENWLLNTAQAKRGF